MGFVVYAGIRRGEGKQENQATMKNDRGYKAGRAPAALERMTREDRCERWLHYMKLWSRTGTVGPARAWSNCD